MKKFSTILTVLAVLMFVLTACGPKPTEVVTTPPPATEPPATEPPATAVPPTAAPTEVTVEDCIKAEVFCVALVTDVGRVDDKSFNQSSWEALNQALDEGVVDLVQYIETADAKDYLKNMQTFGDGGFDMIVTSGYNAGASTVEAAVQYPEIFFAGVDQPNSTFDLEGTATNFAGVEYKEDQSAFLAGALAALVSTTHKIGAVAGLSSIPAVWRFGEGYKAGAAYIDGLNGTTTEVTVTYHDDVTIATAFTDPVWGKTTADSMISKGVDIIFGIGGTTGNAGPEAAAAAGALGIGVDKDQYYELVTSQSRLLTSAMKNIKLDVYNLIQAAVAGTFPGGVTYAGTNGLAPYHDCASLVTADMQTMIDTAQAGLADGTLLTGVSKEKPATP
jgi:basic membrane protein A and related proteins